MAGRSDAAERTRDPARVVSAVVVHWRRPEECLRTVSQLVGGGVLPEEIVVVDNGSPVGQVALLVRQLPAGVSVVALGRNAGFGPAANIGLLRWLRRAETHYSLVLPHDVDLAEGCLPALVEAMESRPELGVAFADVGDARVPRFDPALGAVPGERVVSGDVAPADYPHGTLMVIRREAALDVGLFDESYFAYGEEVDLGFRMRDHGWDVAVVGSARVENRFMGPGPGPVVVAYLQHRNTIRLVGERFGAGAAVVRTLLGLRRGWRESERLRLGEGADKGMVRGVVDAWRRRVGAPEPSWFKEPPAVGPCAGTLPGPGRKVDESVSVSGVFGSMGPRVPAPRSRAAS
ncbi:MAG: hypothetical protein KatS3mg008_0192 [Acidimicrobiales bacterium]|nr:MAG: hypothetical protein KatS3mg008_0192 [Acidimicrobiales bacterium]